MKLLIVDRPSASVVVGVEGGLPVLSAYPIFIVEPESREDIEEANQLFVGLFERYRDAPQASRLISDVFKKHLKEE